MDREEQRELFDGKYLNAVEQIQDNALFNDLPNGIKVELTYQQALSILLREGQLKREGSSVGKLSKKAKLRQIERCYEQQY